MFGLNFPARTDRGHRTGSGPPEIDSTPLQLMISEEQAVHDIHDMLKAYYKVLFKRFTDNVIIQVVERHILGNGAGEESSSTQSKDRRPRPHYGNPGWSRKGLPVRFRWAEDRPPSSARAKSGDGPARLGYRIGMLGRRQGVSGKCGELLCCKYLSPLLHHGQGLDILKIIDSHLLPLPPVDPHSTHTPRGEQQHALRQAIRPVALAPPHPRPSR